MGNPVVHFEVTGSDLEKLASFYESLFGWKVQRIPEMQYGLVDTDAGGAGIAGGIGSEGTRGVTFYVQVADPQEHLEQAVALGGTVIEGVTEVPGVVTMALFADPEGHVIGLVKEEAG